MNRSILTTLSQAIADRQLELEKMAGVIKPVITYGTLGSIILGQTLQSRHLKRSKKLLQEAGGPKATSENIRKLVGDNNIRILPGRIPGFYPHIIRRGIGTMRTNVGEDTLAEILPGIAKAQNTKDTLGRRALRAVGGLGGVGLALGAGRGVPSTFGSATIAAWALHNISRREKDMLKAYKLLHKLPMSDTAKKKVREGWEEQNRSETIRDLTLLGVAGLHGVLGQIARKVW